MKRFTFPLERIRQWRSEQLTVEEARMEQLVAEMQLVEQRRSLLEQEGRESASLVCHNTTLDATELQAIDAFQRHVRAQRVVLANLIADCDRRIAEQQRVVVEARRRVELLDKLKSKGLKAWNTEFAREIEAQAGEAFLAKWNAEQRRRTAPARPADVGRLTSCHLLDEPASS